MRIIVDTREHENAVEPILQAFTDAGHEYIRQKLDVGDYMDSENETLSIDRKQNMSEVCSNVCQQHARFIRELDRAKEQGIRLIILVADERITSLDDVQTWLNPRRLVSKGAIKGDKLYKMLSTIETRHGCEFRFCKPSAVPETIVNILSEG